MEQLLTYAQFADCLNQSFRLVSEDNGPVDLQLIEAEPLPTDPAREGERQPFSLVFRCPQQVGQGTFVVEHDKLGTFAIFIVPISSDQEGNCYQAIFN